MKVFLATDHAGFAHKEALKQYLVDGLGYEVEDCGALSYEETDDYPVYIAKAAAAVAREPEARAIIFGGSGQGEAMVANRFAGVRATVYYGNPGSAADADGAELDIIAASRLHNDANVLSIGARFVGAEEVPAVVQRWLTTDFSGEERHQRRIEQIDDIT